MSCRWRSRCVGAVSAVALGTAVERGGTTTSAPGWRSATSALRELWAALLDVKAKVARDPGIRMAAVDLHEAAAALVASRSAGPDGVDVRRWRLLTEADARLRTRLASAQPSEAGSWASTDPKRLRPGSTMQPRHGSA